MLGGGQEEGRDGWGPVLGLAGFGGFVLSLADYTGGKMEVTINGFDLKLFPKLRERAIMGNKGQCI